MSFLKPLDPIHHIIYSHCYPALQGVTFQIRVILHKKQKYYDTDCLHCLLICICSFISHTRLLELWRRRCQLCLGDNVDHKASSKNLSILLLAPMKYVTLRGLAGWLPTLPVIPEHIRKTTFCETKFCFLVYRCIFYHVPEHVSF